MKKNKGITLVALAVTIIILIILALVTINLTIGNNGLITRAKEMQNYMTNAQKSDEELINQILEELEEEPENPDVKEKFIIRVVDKIELGLGNIVYTPDAIIAIYTDASCTNLFKEIEVQNGIYETNIIPESGTYFVKIKKQPDGYNWITEVLEFEIKDIKENIWTIEAEKGTSLPATNSPWVTEYNRNSTTNINAPVRFNLKNYDESKGTGNVKIYKIATYDISTTKYSYIENFVGLPIEDINNAIENGKTKELAKVLETYVYKGDIQPTMSSEVR